MRLSFRAKLALIVGAATLAFALLTVTSAVFAKTVETRLDTIQGRYLPKIELEPVLDSAFEKLRRGFQDAVAAHDTEGLAATLDLKRQLLERLAAASPAVDREKAAALRDALEDYCAAAYDVSRRLMAEEAGEALVEAIDAMQAKQTVALAALRSVTSFDRRELALRLRGDEPNGARLPRPSDRRQPRVHDRRADALRLARA